VEAFCSQIVGSQFLNELVTITSAIQFLLLP
jgi:hypothetical protein